VRQQSPETIEPHHVADVLRFEIDGAVSLPFVSQYRVGAHRYRPVDHAGQVHAQKRQFGIGNGVDQMVDNAIVPGRKAVVFAPERNDLEIDADAGHFCQSVGHQAGTGDDITGLDHAAIQSQLHRRRGFRDGVHLLADQQSAATRLKSLGHLPGDALVVGDPGGGHEQGANAVDVWLLAAQRPRRKGFHGDAVLAAAHLKGIHAVPFQRIGGHQQFAALFIGQAVFAAKRHGGSGAAFAKVGLEAARLVVDTGMDDPGIAAGLMLGQGCLFFDQGNAGVRVALLQLPGR